MTDTTPTTVEDEAALPVYLVPVNRLGEAKAAIDKANRKLARHGIGGQFTYTCEQKIITITTPSGAEAEKLVAELTLNVPALRLAGWEFIATLVHEEAGVIARVVPGRSLDRDVDGDRDLDTVPVCDHCRTSRRRRDTYVVRHSETGETKQVGSNCLEAFLGVKPTGLWLLMAEPLEDLRDEWESSAGSAADCRVPIRDIIRYSLAASNMGTGFISRSAAEAQNRTATAATVHRMMFERLTGRQRAELAEEFDNLDRVTAEQIDTVITAGQDIEGSSDYADNLRVALAGRTVDSRNLALVASAVSVWQRAISAQAEREANAATPGFLAPIGEQIRDVRVTVTFLRHRDGYMPGSTETIIGMRTTDGRKVKWFAAGYREYPLGAELVIRSARVKKHDQWRGEDETVVIRARLEEVALALPAAG